MPYRHDLVEIKSPTIDQNGYLVADAFPTRAGVFKYVKSDGNITRELRHPEDVFNPVSLETLKHRPIVDEHPDGGPMHAENTRGSSVGHVGEQVEQVENHVKANVVVTDAGMIAKMMGKNGQAKRELSCGYMADVTDESGVFEGEPYDSRQRNIVYNHLAAVWKARAGGTARIHLDGDDAVSDSFELIVDGGKGRGPSNRQKPYREKVMTIKLKREAVTIGDYRQDAVQVEYDPESEGAVTALGTRLDDAHAQIKVMTDKYDAEVKGHTKTKGEKDQLDEDLKKKKDGPDPVELNRLAAARADVMGVAHHMGLKEIEEKTDAEIKALVVEKHNPDFKTDGVDPLIVEGRYGIICDAIRKENKGLESLAALRSVTTGDPKNDRLDKDADPSPREKFIEDVQGLHNLNEQQIRDRWNKSEGDAA